MGEFEEREKLGMLPDDISRERGELPFERRGTIKPGSIPPDVRQRRSRQRTKTAADPRATPVQIPPVVSVYDARPIGASDFLQDLGGLASARLVRSAGNAAGDVINSAVTYSDVNYTVMGVAVSPDFLYLGFCSTGGGANHNVLIQQLDRSFNVLHLHDTNISRDLLDGFVYIKANGLFAWGVVSGGVEVYSIEQGLVRQYSAADLGLTTPNPGARGVAVDERDGYLYYGDNQTGDILRVKIDLNSMQINPSSVETFLSNGMGATGFCIDNEERYLYLENTGTYYVYSLNDGSLVTTFALSVGVNATDSLGGFAGPGYLYTATFNSNNLGIAKIWPVDSDPSETVTAKGSITVPSGYYGVLTQVEFSATPMVAGLPRSAMQLSLTRNDSPVPEYSLVAVPYNRRRISCYLLGDSNDRLGVNFRFQGTDYLSTTGENRAAVTFYATLYGNLIPYDGREVNDAIGTKHYE